MTVDQSTQQETVMKTEISTKLAALGVALVMNTAIIGGVAYLFNAQLHQATPVTSLVSAAGHAAVKSV
jgi:hypothetical protein